MCEMSCDGNMCVECVENKISKQEAEEIDNYIKE